VIVVDSSGGGDFTNLQMAVDTATSGDTLLVRVGGYSSFTIDGKSLSVVADAGTTVTVFGSIVVQNLAADQSVVLAGLKVTGATTTSMSDTPGVALYATANSGPLRVQRCHLTGAIGYGDHYANSNDHGCCAPVNHGSGWTGAVLVQNHAGVAFVGCTIVGGRAANASLGCEVCGYGALGGDGLFLDGTRVALYDCTITGGRGGDAAGHAGVGGSGCFAETTTAACGLFASGTTFTGGVGGDGNDIMLAYGGIGGDGLVVISSALAQLLDCTAVGGHGGHNCGLDPYAPNGNGINGDSPPFVFTGTRLAFSAPSPMRESTATPVSFTGQPGEHVYLRMADETGFRPIASSKGVQLTHSAVAHQPVYAADFGVIPASGVLNTTLQFPDVASARSYQLQAFSIDSDGHTKLGSFASIVVLDSAY
jgi:hypothetical protein